LKQLSALILVAALVFSFGGNSYAQYTIQLTGGYNMPLPDLKGTWPDDSAKNPMPYFQKNGFNFGATGKWHIDKKRNFGVTLSLGYNMFSSGDITITGGTESRKMNFFQAAVGGEYTFLPKGKVNPFIGAEFTANFFSGKWTTTPTSGTATEMTLKSASRFGFNVGFGFDFTLHKQIGIVVGGKFHMPNLIAKDYDSTFTSTTEYALNDKEYTSGGVTYKAKNMMYFQFYAGVSFYLGKPFKKK
jgi:hypothetical protein